MADGICKKLIFRHPHVFGDVSVSGTDEVLVNWEVLKREEKGQETYSDTLRSVARSLPALWRAEKVQKKAKKAGFDWPDASGAMDKLSEELEELKQAVTENSNVAEELGDLLFAAVNVSRFVKADPEEALTAATDKFISRFEQVERLAAQTGQDMAECALEELDKLWEEAKTRLNGIRALSIFWRVTAEKKQEETIMNKAELINAAAEKAGLSKKDTEAAVNAAIEAIADCLAAGRQGPAGGLRRF